MKMSAAGWNVIGNIVRVGGAIELLPLAAKAKALSSKAGALLLLRVRRGIGYFFALPQVPMEETIASRELTIERKHFSIELRQNERGRFLKITESAHGRRNSVIIPSTGLDEFEDKLDEVLSEGEDAE